MPLDFIFTKDAHLLQRGKDMAPQGREKSLKRRRRVPGKKKTLPKKENDMILVKIKHAIHPHAWKKEEGHEASKRDPKMLSYRGERPRVKEKTAEEKKGREHVW